MEMYGYNVELKSALTNAEIGRIVDGANGPYTTAFAMSGMSHKPGEDVYKRQLEFIDMEHTPKNILIRAVKTGRKAKNREEIKKCEEQLHVSPMLGRLLEDKGEL